jgi:hypothetical protein
LKPKAAIRICGQLALSPAWATDAMTKAEKKNSPPQVGRRTKGRLIDSHPQVKLRRSDRVQLCDLLTAKGPAARYAIREILFLIRRYRNDDGVFKSFPMKSDPLAKFASMARKLRQFLIDNRLNFEVDNADWFIPPSKNLAADRGPIDSDKILENLIRRSELAAQHDGSNRGTWHAKSNSDNPPRKHFLTELMQLWHVDLGLPLRVKARNGTKEQLAVGLVNFCGICCELAGEPRPATTTMRDRLAAILAENPKRLRPRLQPPEPDSVK